MLSALLRDLAAADCGKVATLLAPRADKKNLCADVFMETKDDFFFSAQRAIKESDAVWVIAPESGGTLLTLTDMACAAGKTVIGSSRDAVRICGDKLMLARLMEGKIPTPATLPFEGEWHGAYPCVVKPVDGAGCESARFVKNRRDLQRLDTGDGRFIIQPYIAGEQMSAGVLSLLNENVVLGVCRQEIDLDLRMRHKGVAYSPRYENLRRVEAVVEMVRGLVPGLSGYWGMDFIDDGCELTLVEINPRLTSSYPVYSAECGFNIASAVLEDALAMSGT